VKTEATSKSSAVPPPEKHDKEWAKKIEIAKTARSEAILAHRSRGLLDTRTIVAGLVNPESGHER
jgi:hypothetical protein